MGVGDAGCRRHDPIRVAAPARSSRRPRFAGAASAAADTGRPLKPAWSGSCSAMGVMARPVPWTRPANDVGLPETLRNNELAARLLDVVNESQLEDFIGGLVAETARNAGHSVRSDAHRALVD